MGMGGNTNYEAVSRQYFAGLNYRRISQGYVKRCAACGEKLEEGDVSYWKKVGRKHVYYCSECAGKLEAEEAPVEMRPEDIPF